MATKVKARDFDELLEGEKQREIAAIAKCKTVSDVDVLMHNIEMIKQFSHTKEQGVEIDRLIAELKELCSKRIIELSSQEEKEIGDVEKAFDLSGDLMYGISNISVSSSMPP